MGDGFKPGDYPPAAIWERIPHPPPASAPEEIYIKYIIVRDPEKPPGLIGMLEEQEAMRRMANPEEYTCTVGLEKRKDIDGNYYWELMCDKDEHFGTQLQT